MKKIIVAGAAAAVVLLGTASASQLAGVSESTLAGKQVTVSGAKLEAIDFSHTYINGGLGNGPKTAVLNTVTVDLDKAGVEVQGRLLQNVTGGNDFAKDVDGKKGGHLAPVVTDAEGRATFKVDGLKIPLGNVDAIDLVVTN